jgi:hypothetical protein
MRGIAMAIVLVGLCLWAMLGANKHKNALADDRIIDAWFIVTVIAIVLGV